MNINNLIINIPKDFNTLDYKHLNKDLENLSDIELKNHYILYGKNENRIYKFNIPEDFKTLDYKYLNKDLGNLSEIELKIHYILYGKNENRIYKFDIPEDFNTLDYKHLNKDLENLSEPELKNHYILYGKNEYRIYKFNISEDLNISENVNISEDFNIPEKNKTLDYKYLNKDLKNLSYNKLKKINSIIIDYNINDDFLDFNDLINNNNNKYSISSYCMGGLCNIMFQVCTALSFCIDNNFNYYFNFDKDDIKCDINKLFKNIDKKNNTTNYTFNENEYKYNNIDINLENNILFKGYFQSYKYFWKNINIIKKYFNFDSQLIFMLKYYKYINESDSKKSLAIHIRLTDYIKASETHFSLPSSYYKNALSKFDLSEYNIFLFSDDSKEATKLLNSINIYNFKCVNDLMDDDFDQLLFLSIMDVRICANSTYSLWSCYINDIYKLNNDAKYILPNLWFGPKGPDYNLYDLIPKNNSNYIIQDVYKCAVIFFHKNIYNLYEKYWINNCIDSILNQVNVYFDIFEINYGDENISIFEEYQHKIKKNINIIFL